MSDELTKIENDSIRAFVQVAADSGYLSGRVLDYGSGRQPYREIVKAVGEYHPFDRVSHPASISAKDYGFSNVLDEQWSAILCNQVLQYIPNPAALLVRFRKALTSQHGCLVMTYPTNWPEVEDEDLHRFTMMGMERLLAVTGFRVELHERRAQMHFFGYDWALGYGVIARA